MRYRIAFIPVLVAICLMSHSSAGGAPIHDAVREGNRAEIIRLIDDEKTNINSRDKNGDTVMHIAVSHGDKGTVAYLIVAGVNIDAMSNDGETALHIASRKGHHVIAEILVAEGANLNAKNSKGWTPLHIASKEGNLKMVDLFTKNSCNVNAIDKTGQTALHKAAQISYPEVVQHLLEAGADTSVKDKGGNNPRELAIKSHNKDVLALFDEHSHRKQVERSKRNIDIMKEQMEHEELTRKIEFEIQKAESELYEIQRKFFAINSEIERRRKAYPGYWGGARGEDGIRRHQRQRAEIDQATAQLEMEAMHLYRRGNQLEGYIQRQKGLLDQLQR